MFFRQKIGSDPKKEVSFLFRLINMYFNQEIKNIISQGIRINIMGELKLLSPSLRNLLKKRNVFNKK